MDGLQVLEVKGIRVLTTKQLAEAYGATEEKIRWNFKYNRDRYVQGKHHIIIAGDELREMKRKCEFHTLFKQAKSVCFWTEKGALLHAKSLNTDKAWEVYDYLVDHYFRTKEDSRQQSSADKQEIVPVTTTVEKIPDALPDKKKMDKFVIPEMNHPVMIFHTLLDLAEQKNIKVRVLPLKASRSLLHGERIGIGEDLTFNEITYELAYELAHAMIHYDDGDMINSPLRKHYDEQAERAATMMIELLNIKIAKLG